MYEPGLALDGGKDGLKFYRNICKYWLPKLKIGGTLAFEIGQGQFETVGDIIMRSFRIADVKAFKDINNIIRAVVGKK